MRNPFRTLKVKTVEAGAKTAIDSAKERTKDHLKENWKDYLAQGITMVGSGVVAGLVGNAVTRPPRNVVKNNRVVYNITINKY